MNGVWWLTRLARATDFHVLEVEAYTIGRGKGAQVFDVPFREARW